MTATELDLDARTAGAAALELVCSAEPAVVFGSLAARCVPDLCDAVGIDLVDGRPDDPGSAARYSVRSPLVDDTATTEHRLAAAHPHRVTFGVPGTDAFHGTAAFTWHDRRPTAVERTLADMLVQHAVRTVSWQRSELAARAANLDAEHLQIALRSSREIGAAVGILMKAHRMTQADAFELLRRISQHVNRKVRDLAAEVVATGWLDPAVLDVRTGGSRHQRRHTGDVLHCDPGQRARGEGRRRSP